jgi:hypothetical protein
MDKAIGDTHRIVPQLRRLMGSGKDGLPVLGMKKVIGVSAEKLIGE